MCIRDRYLNVPTLRDHISAVVGLPIFATSFPPSGSGAKTFMFRVFARKKMLYYRFTLGFGDELVLSDAAVQAHNGDGMICA